MLHIEIHSLGFALFVAPFGWYDVVNDEKRPPCFRMLIGQCRIGSWSRK